MIGQLIYYYWIKGPRILMPKVQLYNLIFFPFSTSYEFLQMQLNFCTGGTDGTTTVDLLDIVAREVEVSLGSSSTIL